MIESPQLKKILEGVLLAAGKPLPLDRLEALFMEHERPERDVLEAALNEISEDCAERGYELKKVASGYRLQVRQELAEWVSRLWEEKPQKYSRALMETLSIIAYRQPITRGDIEKIRGVAVSTQIVQTLLEHEWVRVVGHRDVPGRPAMYATTKQFLDYFNLESLEQLPPLADIRDLDDINRGLALEGDKPQGRIIEFPTMGESEEELVQDDDEKHAAEIGTRPISEILDEVDTKLGLKVEPEFDLEGGAVEASGGEEASDAAAPDTAGEAESVDAAPEPESGDEKPV
ncbi:MAG TPA: SMC-Scp complex subunit ScpB [Pseudomonadales bacterium]